MEIVGVETLCKKYGSEYVGAVYVDLIEGRKVVFDNVQQLNDFYHVLLREGFRLVVLIEDCSLKLKRLPA